MQGITDNPMSSYSTLDDYKNRSGNPLSYYNKLHNALKNE